MKILLPSKFILLFESESNVVNALDESCELWNIFGDLRRWSEGENFSERCIWIDCFGIPPKCWSLDNIRKIGEKWGSVVCLDRNTEI